MPDYTNNPHSPPQISGERELYREICVCIEEGIISGAFPEESQVPSTNQLARVYTINPATALKGVNLLVEQGVLYKKRGIGMFVSAGAREELLKQRRERFAHEYIVPLLREARHLGMNRDELVALIDMEDK